jgi:glycosyltransferase involved in cell wall biosynthesis
LKVLHLSTEDFVGGAARAAFRLHCGLISHGVHSHMLVQYKHTNDSTINGPTLNPSKAFACLRPTLDGLLKLGYRKRKNELFHSQWVPDFIDRQVRRLNPDIIHLHWICRGFLNVNTLARFQLPVIWTLHDMWPFTGGCHYARGCRRFINSCGRCPNLGSNKEFDLSKWVWKRKYKIWKNIPFTVVAGSSWIASCAKNSKLFNNKRIEIIPTGLDTKIFKPVDKKFSRATLNLPKNKSLVLFGALDPEKDDRKGFPILKSALNKLSKKLSCANTEIVIFGSSGFRGPIDFGFNCHFLGNLNDDFSLCLAYNSADVMVVPSLQEAFGQTASESLSCGTPVVAFNATGLMDVVDHKICGYLAEPYKSDALAEGIIWVLNNIAGSSILNKNSRERAINLFDVNKQANQYIQLYNEILPERSLCYK